MESDVYLILNFNTRVYNLISVLQIIQLLLRDAIISCKRDLRNGTYEPSIKDVHTLGGSDGQVKVDKCAQGEGGKPNVDVRLEKNIATIFVKFTQIIWQHVSI